MSTLQVFGGLSSAQNAVYLLPKVRNNVTKLCQISDDARTKVCFKNKRKYNQTFELKIKIWCVAFIIKVDKILT